MSSAFFAFHDPLSRAFHYSGLELVFFVAMALTLSHALSRFRAGDRHALFQWLVAVSYGVLIEVAAYNYLDNFYHAKFTIQLYRDQLPLYVVFVYPVFHYAGLKVVERWGLGLYAEALLAGFTMFLIDVPFDVAGIDAKWWIWRDTDPHLAVRWLGVPVTSYYWYMLFGGIYAVLCRLLRARLAAKPFWVSMAIAPLVAAGVMGFGAVSFWPFHLLVWLGVPDSAVVVAHVLLCIAVALRISPPQPVDRADWRADRRADRRADWRITVIPMLIGGYCLSVLATNILLGDVPRAPVKLIAAAAGLFGSTAMTLGWPAALRVRLKAARAA